MPTETTLKYSFPPTHSASIENVNASTLARNMLDVFDGLKLRYAFDETQFACRHDGSLGLVGTGEATLIDNPMFVQIFRPPN